MAAKVQDAFNAGLPDVDACFNGVVAKVELKYAPKRPVRSWTKMTFSKNKVTGRPCVASPAQINQLRQWSRCGGHAFLLIGISHHWFLIDIDDFTDVMNDGLTYDHFSQVCVFYGTEYQTLNQIPNFLETKYARS